MNLVSLEPLKKRIYSLIFLIGWLANLVTWYSAEVQGFAVPPTRVIFAAGGVLMPLLVYLVWRPGFPSHIVDGVTVLYVASVSAATIAISFYSPYRHTVALEGLYMWIPVMYMFTFSQANRNRALSYSVVLWLLLFLVSLPFLLRNGHTQAALFNIQLHFMSVFCVAAFYFYATYQQHLHIARLNVDEFAALANTDPLTQVANRRRILELMNAEHIRFERYDHPYALVLMDIDHFKGINDTFGHDVGDAILRALALHIGEALREVDTLGRWGGEELIALLPETRYGEALKKAEQICSQVARTVLLDTHTVTVSCGVTEVDHGDDIKAVFKRADNALYSAKANGRNCAQGLRKRALSPTA